MTEESKTTEPDIPGMAISFHDGRQVALFNMLETFGCYGVQFTAEDGKVTKLGLTPESLMALVRLYIEDHDANVAFIENDVVRFGRG